MDLCLNPQHHRLKNIFKAGPPTNRSEPLEAVTVSFGATTGIDLQALWLITLHYTKLNQNMNTQW